MNEGRPFWATVGGGLEPGESVQDGALRETLEETGLGDITLGPVVWTDDVIIDFGGEPLFFRETYIVAHTQNTELAFHGWTELERSAIKDARWWTVAEIAAEREDVYPEILADWLPDILARQYPTEQRLIPRRPDQRPKAPA